MEALCELFSYFSFSDGPMIWMCHQILCSSICVIVKLLYFLFMINCFLGFRVCSSCVFAIQLLDIFSSSLGRMSHSLYWCFGVHDFWVVKVVS